MTDKCLVCNEEAGILMGNKKRPYCFQCSYIAGKIIMQLKEDGWLTIND